MVELVRAQRPTGPGIVRLALYVGFPAGVLGLAAALRPAAPRPIALQAGLAAGLAGFVLLALQPVLAARLRWTEWPFGLDRMLKFHRLVAPLAGVLLMAHPLLVAAGKGRWALVWSLDLPWYILCGKAALGLLAVQWVISEFRVEVGLEFQKWRWAHNLLGGGALVLGFLHSYRVGQDLRHAAMRILWPAGLAAVAAVYAYHKLLRSVWMRRRPFRVTRVSRETHDVTTVALAPPAGHKRLQYWPGQFHFVNFHRRDKSLPTEEHHWTISSAPGGEELTSTIKAVGDFTSTIDRTAAGDTAEVLGPYGRFSYVLHDDENALVFIAGGIGITPLMSMIRHLHDTGAGREVLLLYGSRSEKDIVFRRELEEIAESSRPRLTVVYVLSEPEDGWTGRRGYVNAALLREQCGQGIEGKSFYVCGPPAMREMVTSALRKMGVRRRRIHTERFSL